MCKKYVIRYFTCDVVTGDFFVDPAQVTLPSIEISLRFNRSKKDSDSIILFVVCSLSISGNCKTVVFDTQNGLKKSLNKGLGKNGTIYLAG